MKKICVVTGTRAEYGLLYHTIKAIEKSETLELQLVVTGGHLSSFHGMTVNEIKRDGFKIAYEIDILTGFAGKSGIAKSMGALITRLADCFDELKPDILLVLGDRYEMLAACSCAVAMNIPIAHIGGGEAAEGVIDEQIRHAITKTSNIHFTTTEKYKQNVINMGEQAFRVLNVGAPVCENLGKSALMTVSELEKALKIKITRPLFVITYHPETLTPVPVKERVNELLSAMEGMGGTFVFTGANADFGGREINELLKKHVSERENRYFFQSLGGFYLSLCGRADIMLGNSSSGIIEAPCLRLPVVNIGERQRGRLRHINIIDVLSDSESIRRGIEKALYDEDFKRAVSQMDNLYGDGTTSEKIVKALEEVEINAELIMKKLVWERRYAENVYNSGSGS